MKILIIDNTIDQDSWGAADLRKFAQQESATVTVRRAPAGDLPDSPRGFDRIMLSGSKTSALEDAPWIESLHEFVRTALNENIPYLGVCYGHQTLARVLGGKSTCRSSSTPEIGWTRIEVTGESPLFKGLPKSFYSFSRHFEEVGDVPSPLRNIARSESCAAQAVEIPGKPVYGIQFHPERDIAGAEATLTRFKKSKEAELLLHPNRSQELYDPNVGETLFRNFLS